MKNLLVSTNSDIVRKTIVGTVFSDEFTLYIKENNVIPYYCACSYHGVKICRHFWVTIPDDILILFLMKFNIETVEYTNTCEIIGKMFYK